MTPAPTRVDCAWCGAVIREGVAPISHGACVACYTRVLGPELQQLRKDGAPCSMQPSQPSVSC